MTGTLINFTLIKVCRCKSVFIAVLFCLLTVDSIAQGKKISGKVLSEADNTKMPGVNVVIKGTPTGTITDINGEFSIKIQDPESVLVFSSIGFTTYEIKVGSQTSFEILLKPSSMELDEITVVGYGVQEKVSVTGAVVGVKGNELVKSPAINLTNSLAGRMAGVQVVQDDAEPGNDDAEIKIRGNNTFGDTRPLIVIDGIPDRDGGIGRLNPKDIESISVLKDASAAIYGARAANGAIIVTSKQGSIGKPTINFDVNQGWAQPAVIPEMANSYEYASMINEHRIYNTIPVNEWKAAWESIQTSGVYHSPAPGIGSLSVPYSPKDIKLYANGKDPWGHPDTDWFGEVFQSWAPQRRYDIQLSGGTKNIRYFTSAGYIHQDAYYKNSATFYKQYSARINLETEISQWININIGILGRREDRNYPTVNRFNIFQNIINGRPTDHAVWPTGEPGPDISDGNNPVVVTTNQTGYDNQITDYFQSNGKLLISQPWLEGLTLELSGAIDYRISTRKLWQIPWTLYYSTGEIKPDSSYVLYPAVRSPFSDPRLTRSTSNALNTNLTAIVYYKNSFYDHHNVNALLGVTKEIFKGSDFMAYRRNYISSSVDQLNAGGIELQNTDGGAFERARLGYYGRIQYDYDRKYLLEFIFRNDGSYIFPEDKRFRFFPGILAGWNLSNETFFKVGWIDFMKIRTTYGTMGNDVTFFDGILQEYAFLYMYEFREYPIDKTVKTTLLESRLPNQEITWEIARKFNLGLDATFFRNELDLSFDYFYNTRENIPVQKAGTTPASTGIVALLPPVNFGRVDNSGLEFNVSYRKNRSTVRWSAGINAGYAKNKIIFMDEIPGAPDWQRKEGKPIGSHLVYLYDGVFLDAEDINENQLDYSGVTPDLRPGDMKFKDVDGNGIINGDDQVRLEESVDPVWNYGASFNLKWKGFELTLLLQGAAGHSMHFFLQSGDIGNYLKEMYKNRWSIDKPSNIHPRIDNRGDTYYTGGGYGNNTYYLYDKDYLRLKNLEIGYNVPMGNQNIIKGFRIYLRGFNLFTISSNNIVDPESDYWNGRFYPQARIVSTGFSIGF